MSTSSGTGAGTGASTDVLAAYDDEPDRKPAPWLLVAGIGVLVLAIVTGVTYGFRALSGGGTQPEDVLPAGAFAFAEIDLDPPAGQKVDGFRFLRQFPALAEKLNGDDLRRAVFEAVAADAGWGDIDYATQVEPWLGQRLAVAAYPTGRFGGGGEAAEEGVPTVVVALQVTDEGAATEGIDRLVTATDGANAPGYVVDGGFAFFAETTAVAEQAVAAAAEGTLVQSAEFAADMSGLGDGVASAWIDMSAAEGLAGLANPLSLGAVGNMAGVTTVAGGTGRAAYVLRFDGADAIEVAGSFTAADAVTGIGSASLDGLAELPASTVLAFGLAGGDQMVDPMWASIRQQLEAAGAEPDEMVAEAEKELGLTLPDDLRTVLGSNLLATLDDAGLRSGELQVGVRATTDVTAARPLVERMTALLQQLQPEVRSQMTDDGYVIATSGSAARRLVEQSGDTLADTEAFGRALPDADDARIALWVDVKPLITGISGSLGGDSTVDPNLEPLAGFGMTVSTTDDGSGSFRMRLVTD